MMPEIVRCTKCKQNVPKMVRKEPEGNVKKVTYVENVGTNGVCVPCMEKATAGK